MVRKKEKNVYLIERSTGDLFNLTYILDNNDPIEITTLQNILEKNSCRVAVCWQSKFDRNIISLTEPKVYDAYNCIVIAKGTEFSLKSAICKYHLRLCQVKYLEYCLSEGIKEIKTWTQIEREKNPIDYAKLASTIIV